MPAAVPALVVHALGPDPVVVWAGKQGEVVAALADLALAVQALEVHRVPLWAVQTLSISIET